MNNFLILATKIRNWYTDIGENRKGLERWRQAGAELCQAQDMLGRAKPSSGRVGKS
jgi:hypothetical protein